MMCQPGGFIIQRHSELRDLEAGMLRMVCNDVEVEPVLQEVTGETLNHGANKAHDARLEIHAKYVNMCYTYSHQRQTEVNSGRYLVYQSARQRS